jgi:Lon protease-like protein
MSLRLPLFPLELVLLPGELVPLHIFEPRYRKLLSDCLAGDRRFGIVTGAVPGAVGTIAGIRGSQALPDGRAHLVVQGEHRFRVATLIPGQHPYLVASVEEFEDLVATAPEATALDRLRSQGESLRDSLGILSDRAGESGPFAADAEALSFQVAALLDLDLEARSRLVAERSTRARVEWLQRLLPDAVLETASRAELHLRARTNGQGPHGPAMMGPA